MRALAAYRQFVVVLFAPLPNGKTDKIPCSPAGVAGVNAHDPANWVSHDEARALAAAWGPRFGVGFVLTTGDPFFCVDIDGCRLPDGGWSAWATSTVAALPGCAVEVSQSGRGLHIWGRWAQPQPHVMKRVDLGTELYTEARFIALGDGSHTGAIHDADCSTIAAWAGQHFPARTAVATVTEGGPRPEWRGPADDDQLLLAALGARSSMGAMLGSKATFQQLWNADGEALGRVFPSDGEAYDASSADMALASHLAFWTGCDVPRMERLMRKSALARAKWDERSDYLVERTITSACGLCRDVYRDPRLAPAAPAAAAVAVPVGDAAPAGPAITTPSLLVADDRGTWGGQLTMGMPATAPELYRVLASIQGLGIRWDTFSERVVLTCHATSATVEVTELVASRIRINLQRGGFKPIKQGELDTVLLSIAHDHTFDSAIEWIRSLRWDGVPRIDGFCAGYWRTDDTAYTRAVGAYVWTALAGRVLSPGIKADMVPILVGDQGARKSTSVACLAPSFDMFTELDLDKDEADLGRQMRRKLVYELPELQGMSRKDRRALKAFLARRYDEWVEKYSSESVKHARRGLAIGTTNQDEFLDDATGERRYLPMIVRAQADTNAIDRDRDQLWAEGAARFLAGGIEWEAAERLGRAEHAQFKVVDEWSEPVLAWLASNPGPVKLQDVAFSALGIPALRMSRQEQLRIGDVLRGLGYCKKDARGNDGRVVKFWFPTASVHGPGP